MQPQWNDKIFNIRKEDFFALAVEVFHHQYRNNILYRDYVNALHIEASTIRSVEKIPFLPIRFFKSHIVKTGEYEPETVFESSGTTGVVNSRHHVKYFGLYEQSFLSGFKQFYGDIKEYCIIGLLPSYLERNNSSLVYMVNEWIKQSQHPQSGFYLNEYHNLSVVLKNLELQSQKKILIGVSFALLDFAEKYSADNYLHPLQHTIIMETGGMKGRREEMLKQQLHSILERSFGVAAIHSEYGMTELMSQAYSKGKGLFHCPPWMKIVIRDEEDPLLVHPFQTARPVRGAINVIDLANIHSCSFIATDDAGKLYPDGSFEVLGRIDNSDIRGCSLMVV
jgi:phenylacetate-coenzyme A ligase PaaK-like adenylate-forming protein